MTFSLTEKCDTQHNDTQQFDSFVMLSVLYIECHLSFMLSVINKLFMLSVANKPFLLSVINKPFMLNVVMLCYYAVCNSDYMTPPPSKFMYIFFLQLFHSLPKNHIFFLLHGLDLEVF
jgi:hypothetical protein